MTSEWFIRSLNLYPVKQHVRSQGRCVTKTSSWRVVDSTGRLSFMITWKITVIKTIAPLLNDVFGLTYLGVPSLEPLLLRAVLVAILLFRFVSSQSPIRPLVLSLPSGSMYCRHAWLICTEKFRNHKEFTDWALQLFVKLLFFLYTSWKWDAFYWQFLSEEEAETSLKKFTIIFRERGREFFGRY